MADFINKVVFGSETLIDLTADTVDEEHLLKGITAHAPSGETITGTCEFDANTQDATALISEVLEDRTYYAQGVKKTGTMPNIGAQESKITDLEPVAITQGYHDGSGTVSIDDTEKAKLIAGNIKQGVSILGVVGTLSPSSDIKVQEKTVNPTKEGQTVLPDEGFDYLTQVKINPISFTRIENASGGDTATILGA